MPSFITSLNNSSSENNENMNIYDLQDFNSIYKDIISLLNNYINDNKNNVNKLNKYMKLIYDYIYNINNNNIRKNIKSSIKKERSCIQTFNNLLKDHTNDSLSKKNKSNKNINLLHTKYQINEYNYLIYINELHKKIFKLEQELNLNNARQISEKKKLKLQNYSKYFDSNDLKIRNQSFTIINQINNNEENKILSCRNERKSKLKISLEDIFNDINYENVVPQKIKLFKNKNYLLSHPKLDYNGYIHNSNGKLSNIVNEKLNKIPMEAFGVNLKTKLQNNRNSYLYLSFNPTKFKVEGIRSNKNIKGLKS